MINGGSHDEGAGQGLSHALEHVGIVLGASSPWLPTPSRRATNLGSPVSATNAMARRHSGDLPIEPCQVGFKGHFPVSENAAAFTRLTWPVRRTSSLIVTRPWIARGSPHWSPPVLEPLGNREQLGLDRHRAVSASIYALLREGSAGVSMGCQLHNIWQGLSRPAGISAAAVAGNDRHLRLRRDHARAVASSRSGSRCIGRRRSRSQIILPYR